LNSRAFHINLRHTNGGGGVALAKKRNGLFWLCVVIGTPLWLFNKTEPERAIQSTEPSVSQNESVAFKQNSELSVPSAEEQSDNETPKLGVPSEIETTSVPSTYRFVHGAKVNVRTLPNATSIKVATLSQGTKVAVLGETGDWAKIQIGETQGYVLKKYLVRKNPLAGTTPLTATKKAPKSPTNVDAIVKQIISNSIGSYSGRCPCPYHTDRAGRSCGRRSAYSRPGGASVICYAEDVTPAMIASFN
jgi:Bacterial SH3 domain